VKRLLAHLRGRFDLFTLLLVGLVIGSALREQGASRWIPLVFAVAIVVFVLLPDGRPSKLKSYALIAAMAAVYLVGCAYLTWYAWGLDRSTLNAALGILITAAWVYVGVALGRAMLASHRLAQTGVYDHYKRRA
jgi:hypothetical protein